MDQPPALRSRLLADVKDWAELHINQVNEARAHYDSTES